MMPIMPPVLVKTGIPPTICLVKAVSRGSKQRRQTNTFLDCVLGLVGFVLLFRLGHGGRGPQEIGYRPEGSIRLATGAILFWY